MWRVAKALLTSLARSFFYANVSSHLTRLSRSLTNSGRYFTGTVPCSSAASWYLPRGGLGWVALDPTGAA